MSKESEPHPLLVELESSLNEVCKNLRYDKRFGYYEIRKRVISVSLHINLYIYSNDHPPPHVHIRLSNKKTYRYTLTPFKPMGDSEELDKRIFEKIEPKLFKEGGLEILKVVWDEFHS